MPHLHLTTSADLVENVDVPDILEALVTELLAIDTVNSAAVKAYHTLFNTWCMGQGAPNGFAHLEVKLLCGRTLELKNQVVDRLYSALKEAFAVSLENGEVSLTLELVEMDAEVYRK